MKPDGRTSSYLSWGGSPLSGWSQVTNADNTPAGTNQQVVGGTQYYTPDGAHSGFKTTDGVMHDASGNPSPNHDPYRK